MQALLYKISKLRPLVRDWEKETKKIADRSLCDIEEAIHLFEEDLGVEFFSVDYSVKIKELYSQKQKIWLIRNRL